MINTDQQFYASIQIEIIELIKGVEKRNTIEIFSGDGADCRAEVLSFPIGKTFVFSLNYTTGLYTDMPNEKDDDFILSNCFESSIKFIQEKNQVKRLIKGKSYRKKIRNYPYDKLIEKIS